MPLHVFVHFLLQVDSDAAKRAHHYITTYTGAQGNIPTRIIEDNVGRIILFRDTNLLSRRGDNAHSQRGRRLRITPFCQSENSNECNQ